MTNSKVYRNDFQKQKLTRTIGSDGIPFHDPIKEGQRQPMHACQQKFGDINGRENRGKGNNVRENRGKGKREEREKRMTPPRNTVATNSKM